MAVNQNPALPNRHVLYCASSGGGKTQAMGANLPKSGRVLFWDTHKTFGAIRCASISDFKRTVATNYKKTNFRIGYNGPGTAQAFEHFCSTCWDILNGDLITNIVIDEVAEVATFGKAKQKFGELLRGARKFGGVLHISATSPTEVPSTMRKECHIKFTGILATRTDQKIMADFYKVTIEDFDKIEPMEFLILDGKTIEKRKIKYKDQPL